METKRLSQQDIQTAADLLRAGGLVGIPTETVYGLGANGLDPAAVGRIFQAKGRPQDNPLILHIPGADWLERYCRDIPAAAYELAPSGNTSGRPSPTTAAHMLEDMDGRIDAILDGGPCSVGVESTIVDLTCTPPRLLRPGGITLEQLRAALGEVAVDPAVTRLMGAGERPRAPGMKYRHYAPKAPVTVVTGEPERSAAYIAAHAGPGDGVICFEEFLPMYAGGARPVMSLGPAGDKGEQARRVFDALRAFDHTAVSAIWAQCPDSGGIGLAVTNRLNKAAGFHIVEA